MFLLLKGSFESDEKSRREKERFLLSNPRVNLIV